MAGPGTTRGIYLAEFMLLYRGRPADGNDRSDEMCTLETAGGRHGAECGGDERLGCRYGRRNGSNRAVVPRRPPALPLPRSLSPRDQRRDPRRLVDRVSARLLLVHRPLRSEVRRRRPELLDNLRKKEFTDLDLPHGFGPDPEFETLVRQGLARVHWTHELGVSGITEKVARDGAFTARVPTITGAVTSRELILARDWRIAQRVTNRPVKITLPGPMTIADSVANEFYSVGEITQRLGQALEHIDPDPLVAAPDCGLGLLGRDLAIQELSNLCTAARGNAPGWPSRLVPRCRCLRKTADAVGTCSRACDLFVSICGPTPPTTSRLCSCSRMVNASHEIKLRSSFAESSACARYGAERSPRY